MMVYLCYLFAEVVLHGLSQHLLTNVFCEHGRHGCGVVDEGC